MRQAQRSFVERLDFRTSPGHSGDPEHDRARGWSGSGPTSVVTDLGTYGFDEATGEMTLRTLHPGVTLDDVRAEHGLGPERVAGPGRDPRADRRGAPAHPRGARSGRGVLEVSSRPRAPEGDDLADDSLGEPDWVERLRLAREQHTREWGQRFVGRRSAAEVAAPPVEPANFEAGAFEMPERQTEAAEDGFFDQDAASPRAAGGRRAPRATGRVLRPGRGLDGHVFRRVLNRDLSVAVRAEGVWIESQDGRRYLDGAGGAIVVNVGHGDRALIDAATRHMSKLQYVHGTMFTTEALEDYADEVSAVLPMDDARIYPVSGGSEAVDTTLKLARAYHLARGDSSRSVVLARRASYHGNTLGALDASGKLPARRPYEPWLGRARHVAPSYDYRWPMTPEEHACGPGTRDDRRSWAPGNVAAFIAEPVAGATLAAAVPSDDYWPAVAEVCRRHGVLLIADEVMTGFGRTGRWFGVDHWGVRPDILTAGKGSTSGYLPFGFCAVSAEVFETVRERGFVHGFTWSHNGLGAAVGSAVIGRLREGLLERSEVLGERVRTELRSALEDCRVVGDVRGLGLMIGIELVRDRASKDPFARTDQVTERVVAAAARDRELLLYSSTGHVDGATATS